MKKWFSLSRLRGVIRKEFIQMRRDRITFAMMVGVPVMQLLLFGYAINMTPKHLPTLIEMNDNAPVVRSIIAGMESSEYFDIQGVISGEDDAARALRRGQVGFVLVIPQNFERDLVRGHQPQILLQADATDPTATASAIGAIGPIVDQAIGQSFQGALARNVKSQPSYEMIIHRLYNPEVETAINIVPGLLGVIMTMTMVMITSMAIVREYERGTMESLLATPVKPFEVMVGKITPYILVGYVQTAIFLLAAKYLFHVPFLGSGLAFFIHLNLFIATNLALGFLISTSARTQMQAMQLSVFTFLPAIMLSGFMFPFAGMPIWAQWIGNVLPATHFIRATRALMLKGGDFADVLPQFWAIAVTLLIISAVALKRYNQTLD